tara:strand:- start:286 stop:447 length:162 start_codon:yes stop_codon:yes gene_type:complete
MLTEYIVLKCDGLFTSREEALVDKVNIFMKEGWQPLGNPFQDNRGIWHQALVK